jgi:hypothetical protein
MTTHLRLVPKSGIVELYLHTHICLLCILLKYLSTGDNYIISVYVPVYYIQVSRDHFQSKSSNKYGSDLQWVC